MPRHQKIDRDGETIGRLNREVKDLKERLELVENKTFTLPLWRKPGEGEPFQARPEIHEVTVNRDSTQRGLVIACPTAAFTILPNDQGLVMIKLRERQP